MAGVHNADCACEGCVERWGVLVPHPEVNLKHGSYRGVGINRAALDALAPKLVSTQRGTRARGLQHGHVRGLFVTTCSAFSPRPVGAVGDACNENAGGWEPIAAGRFEYINGGKRLLRLGLCLDSTHRGAVASGSEFPLNARRCNPYYIQLWEIDRGALASF